MLGRALEPSEVVRCEKAEGRVRAFGKIIMVDFQLAEDGGQG